MKKDYFYMIPAELVENGKHINALLYGLILSYARNSGECYASNKTLAEKLNRKSEVIIRRSLTDLRDEGFIKITNRNSKKRRIKPLVGLQTRRNSDGLKKKHDKKVTGQPDGIVTQSKITMSKITIDSCRIHKLNDKRKHKYIWCKAIKMFFCPNNEKYCLNECYTPCRELTDDWALQSKITARENLWQCRINDPRYKIAFKKIILAFKERDPGGLADKIRRWNNMTKEQIEEYNARPIKRVQE
jgi:hypothetical protein